GMFVLTFIRLSIALVHITSLSAVKSGRLSAHLHISVSRYINPAIAQTTAAATSALTISIGHPRSSSTRSRKGYTTKNPAKPRRLQSARGPGSKVIHMNGAEKYQGGDTSDATSWTFAGGPSSGGKIMTILTINSSSPAAMAPIFKVCSG